MSEGRIVASGLRRARGAVLAASLGLAAALAPATPAEALTLQLEEVARGLKNPLALAEPPDGSGRLFVAEQIGRVRVIGADGRLRPAPFLDLTAAVGELYGDFDERGLLGLAFHPRFASNGLFYVSYNGAPRGQDPAADGLRPWQRLVVFVKELLGREAPALQYLQGTVYVVERRVSRADPDRADPDYARLVLAVDQPQFNHNGGWLGFGPDGYLYLGFGDGGNADDVGPGHAPQGNGQASDTLLGKILRLDVAGRPYAIPPDNPFVGRKGWRGEIWALGFRNPWRCSFDPGSAATRLFCGDVGQNDFEEVDLVVAGGNYGWRIKEGRHCFDPQDASHPATCADDGLTDPIIEYENCTGRERCQGRSVIGGYLYRGAAIPELRGRYVFGDLVDGLEGEAGVIFAAQAPAGGEGPWPFERVTLANPQALGYLFSFGEGQDGELYVLSAPGIGTEAADGRIHKLVRGG